MARVVRFHGTGGPEVLQIEDIEVGDPGPGEIKIRVEAIGLNRAEAMFRSGTYLEEPRLPARLGYEASGVVDLLGPGVAGLRPGDAVSVIPAFSLNQYGVYAEEAIVPASAVVLRPAGLSATESAAVWMAYPTAYGALISVGEAALGDHILIPAASSSVGLAAIQIANTVGAVPIATTRKAEKKERLRQAGAAHVIVTDDQDLVAEVMRITRGKGARIIFDPVAGPWIEKLAQAAAPRGILFVYGYLTNQGTPFPTKPAILKGLNVRGYMLVEVTADPIRLPRAIDFITHGLEAGKLRPIIAKTFPFDQIVEAHRYMESNQQLGKIIVTVAS
jgi:NADPH:quinone reductase-like Zn-dependent oxidoreductase